VWRNGTNAATGIRAAPFFIGSRSTFCGDVRSATEARMNRDEIKGKAEKAKGYIKVSDAVEDVAEKIDE
jgi:hypothetical protein